MGIVGSVFSALFRKQPVAREEFDDLEFVEDSEESLEDEEEIIRRQIRNLGRKLRKCKVKKDSHPTPSAPPVYNDEAWWLQLSRGSNIEQNKGVCFRPVHMVAPVMEVPDTNNPGQIIFKDLGYVI